MRRLGLMLMAFPVIEPGWGTTNVKVHEGSEHLCGVVDESQPNAHVVSEAG
jgi:hypothetical protein